MNNCKKCNNKIPSSILINGIKKKICGRKFCLICSPWKSNNRKDLCISEQERDQKRKHLENERSKKYYHKNSKNQKNKRKQRKEELVRIKGGCCSKCGYNKCMSALVFHHRDANTKKFSLSGAGWTISWDRILQEAEKCDLLCENCHREIHEKLSA